MVGSIVDRARRLGREIYPGLPLIASMSAGVSDSIHFAAAGIAAYGVPGILYEADGGGINGLNEQFAYARFTKAGRG